MATKSKSTSNTTTTARSYASDGSGRFVGGTSSSTPAKSTTTTTATKTSSVKPTGIKSTGGSTSTSYYDAVNYDPRFSGGASQAAVKPVPTAPTSPVTTSDPARDTYAAIMGNIKKMVDSTGNIAITYGGQQYADAQGMFDAQRKQLAQRQTAEIGRINSEFGEAKATQAQTQKSETGTQSMGLARIGGFDSASGQAVLTNLQRVHEGEQQSLLAKRQAAIQQAQQAYEDKDFALAKLQLDDARATEQRMYDRNRDYLNMTLQIKSEERAQAQVDYQKQRDTLADQKAAVQFALENGITKPFYFVGGIGYDTRTGEALSIEEYKARGGDTVNWSNGQIIEPGSKEAKAYAWSMLANYPDSGIDPQKDDLATINAKVQQSRLYKEKFYHGGGGGGEKVNMIELTNMTDSLLNSVKGKDHKISVDDWYSYRESWKASGGDVSDFDKKFAKYANPDHLDEYGLE